MRSCFDCWHISRQIKNLTLDISWQWLNTVFQNLRDCDSSKTVPIYTRFGDTDLMS